MSFYTVAIHAFFPLEHECVVESCQVPLSQAQNSSSQAIWISTPAFFTMNFFFLLMSVKEKIDECKVLFAGSSHGAPKISRFLV